MEISLHLGAHKTATTYLQTRLRRNAPMLAREGVAMPSLTQLRTTLTPALGAATGRGMRARLARHRLAGIAARLIAEARAAGARRLLISDENLIGGCARTLARASLYPDALARMEALAAALEGTRLTLLLSLRSYAGFYASAWGQRLRHGHYRPFDAALRARLVASPRGWPEVAAEIRAAFPAARLVLWRYEDLAAAERPALTAMVGDAARRLPRLATRPLPGFSARAVALIEELASGRRTVPRGRVGEIAAAHPKGPGAPPFDPWSEAERAELAIRYAADLVAMRSGLSAEFLGAEAQSPPPTLRMAPVT